MSCQKSAALDGISGGRSVRVYRYRRKLLCQGTARSVRRLSGEFGLLGRITLGPEDAHRPPGGSVLAQKVPVRLSGSGPHGHKPYRHGGADRIHRMNGRFSQGRYLVHPFGDAFSHRVCSAGRGCRCHDRGSGPDIS